MSLKSSYDVSLFVALHLYNTDIRIRATNSDKSSVLIDGNGECDGISAIDLHNLLNHSDIPGFEDTVGIARCNIMASDRELRVLYSIEVTVEGLNSETRSHVPN
jgi:hypothetical protein